jgi:hypothetical protein
MDNPTDIDNLKNPYTAGVHLSPGEYELIEKGLMGVAHVAKTQMKDMQTYYNCMQLIERLQQSLIAGQGIPEDLAEGFAKRFQAAMVEQNNKKIVLTFRRWLATLIRLEPDPAKAISERITELAFMAAQQGNASAGTSLLALVNKKLLGLRSRYENGLPEAWKEDPLNILKYLGEWVNHGYENIENGEDPWTGDEDLA